jgi:hypothetical protein
MNEALAEGLSQAGFLEESPEDCAAATSYPMHSASHSR